MFVVCGCCCVIHVWLLFDCFAVQMAKVVKVLKDSNVVQMAGGEVIMVETVRW